VGGLEVAAQPLEAGAEEDAERGTAGSGPLPEHTREQQQ